VERVPRRPRDDRDLLVAARTDPGSFGVFYDRHAAALVRHYRRRGLPADLALDLTAETFAAALESLDRYVPGPEPAAAWLYGIAHHVLSRSARRGRIDDEARRRMGVPHLTVTDEGLARIDELTSVRDGDDLLAGALDELPAAHREAVLARVVDDRDYAEIARELQCSEQLVRQRVSRGLGRLRSALGGDRS
jgi:RNA polymerase sigma-70 factor (ECF subfamily)